MPRMSRENLEFEDLGKIKHSTLRVDFCTADASLPYRKLLI